MDQSSQRTVVGVFEDYSTAETAARELVNAGIPRSSIDLKSNFMTGAAGRAVDTEERHEGGISGFFHRLFGGDDDYSGHYSEAVRRGNAVVCVTAQPDQVDQVADILNDHGAVDIDRRAAAYRESGYEKYDPNAPAYSYDQAVNERERFHEGEQHSTIPVVEEELQVGKRVVQRGGVRVHTRVVDKPVEETVRLREERVRVDRRPTDRPVNAGDTERLRDHSVEVTEMAEEPVVQKRARVREEVIVGKETTERTEKIRDNVRHTEVEVEPIKAGDFPADDFRRDYETRYAGSGQAYEAVLPAYEYGYRSASDKRYRGRNWSDVEESLKTDYLRDHPDSTWDRVKGSVRYGWEKVTGKR